MEYLRDSLFILIISFYSFSCSAQIYQWVDEHGVTHFSESPKGTPDEAYPVNPVNNSSPGNNSVISESKNEKQQGAEAGKTMDVTGQEWLECGSELCEKVKKIDPDCKTQDCVDAVRFTNDCQTILCLSERIDFENRISVILKENGESKNPEKAVKEPVKEEEKETLTDKEVLEKCKKERYTRCKKYLEHYRVIYNGTSEEQKKAWDEIKNARNLRYKTQK